MLARTRSIWKDPPSGFRSVKYCAVVTSEGTYSALIARNAAVGAVMRRRYP